MDVLFQKLDIELQHLVHPRPAGVAAVPATKGIFIFIATLD